MSDEPVRWSAGVAPPGLESLLAAAREVPELTDAVRASVRAALPVGPSSPPDSGSSGEGGASPKPGAGTTAVGAGWLTGGVVIAAVVGAAFWLARPGEHPAVDAPAGHPTVVVSPPPSELAPPAVPSRSARSAFPAVDASPAASRARAKAAAPAPVADALAEETKLLTEARQALTSDPAHALERVQAHERRFPRGQLASEREYVRIKALRASGRTAEARSYAERFVKRYPRSPQARHVRAWLSEDKAP